MPQIRDYERELKELQSHFGCEASVFRKFIKTCEKVEKKQPSVQNHYEDCLAITRHICDIAGQMWAHFTEKTPIDMISIVKTLKKYRGTFDHEFLISAEDREFHATYDNLIKMLPTYARSGGDSLMIQSEVENLLSPLKEALEKEAPEFFALTYFLQNRDVKELYEINAERKRVMIKQMLQVEVLRPFLNQVREGGIDSSENFEKLERIAIAMVGETPSAELGGGEQ